jgi:hypothetical protein
MNHAPSFAATVTTLLLITLGCNGAATASPDPCLRDVQVSVIPSKTPIISWAPACGMSSLSVVTVPSSPGGSVETMWGFSVPERSPVGPVIAYGSTPPGGTGSVPRELVAGTVYRVRVVHTVGGDGLLASGERVFTQ